MIGTKRKVFLFLQVILLGLFIAGCGTSNSKSASEIMSDLSDEMAFWNLIFNNEGEKAKALYNIKSFDILLGETTTEKRTKEVTTSYIGEITLESPYATFNGKIYLEYGPTEKEKFVLKDISIDKEGTFTILSLPDEQLMTEAFEKSKKIKDPDSSEDEELKPALNLLQVQATKNPDNPKSCEVSYNYSYDKSPYCVVTRTDFREWEFVFGL